MIKRLCGADSWTIRMAFVLDQCMEALEALALDSCWGLTALLTALILSCMSLGNVFQPAMSRTVAFAGGGTN